MRDEFSGTGWRHRGMGGPKDRCMRGPKGGRGHGPDAMGMNRGMGEWEGHRGRFRGGRGGGGRFFDHGELRHVVLALLGEQPRHGYDIIRAIDERTGGAYSPSPGVIYPTLQLLEDVGHVVPASGDGTRNRYDITPAGRAFLDQNKELIADILARMVEAGRSRAQVSPIIMAAMDNLKSALRGGASSWSEAEAHDVAAAIDAAAERIRGRRKGTGPVSA